MKGAALVHRYPLSPETMTTALRAASEAVTTDDLLGAWIDPEKLPHILARVIVVSAPHVAAGVLADVADELHPVEQPTHVRARWSVKWDRWDLAARLRERAWSLLNWQHTDAVELIPSPRSSTEDDCVFDCDTVTRPLRLQGVAS